jgi:hypothetical protein
MNRKLLFVSLMWISITSFAQVNLTGYKLIANYPLTSDGKEATGLYADMSLNGVVAFKNGGIFSNGNYGGTNSCYIVTPSIDSMKVSDFIVTLDFKIDTVPAGWDPVFIIGQLWRFLGVGLYKQDSTLFLCKNGNYQTNNRSVFKYKMNTWYSLALKHKADFTTLYVNDKIEITNSGGLDTGSDIKNKTHRQISNSHNGMGLTYKGYWRNLKVYAPSIFQISDDKTKNVNIEVYPNPSSGKIYIDLTSVSVSDGMLISLTDLNGKNLFLQKVTHPERVICIEKALSRGCYIVSVKTSETSIKRKIIVL